MQQPEQSKRTLELKDDWSDLRAAVEYWETNPEPYGTGYYSDMEISQECDASIQTFITLVPKLIDAYADLWELSQAMTQAWEQLEASKDSLYVPDAGDMIKIKKDGLL